MSIDSLSSVSHVVTDVAIRTPDPEVRPLIRAVRAVNSAQLLGRDSELRFSYDAGTRRPVMRIVDRRTDEVLSQLPPEEVLRMAETLKNPASGR
ncbi:MAG TPA: flagellar protein FlaG [Bryobacteraceae bacterium]|nr:flagellar protein FlaG [Bryobacteraceae bacterium]